MSAVEPILADPSFGLRLVELPDEARRQFRSAISTTARQQRLVLASLTLRRAVAEARGPDARRAARGRGDRLQLQEGLAELRDLAQGTTPPCSERARSLAAAPSRASPRERRYRLELRRHGPPRRASRRGRSCTSPSPGAHQRRQHASATPPRSWTVDVEDELLVVVIADDGRGGADTGAEARGLRGLADRLHAIGGTLDVQSRPGHGTTLRARVPLGRGRPVAAVRTPERRARALDEARPVLCTELRP